MAASLMEERLAEHKRRCQYLWFIGGKDANRAASGDEHPAAHPKGSSITLPLGDTPYPVWVSSIAKGGGRTFDVEAVPLAVYATVMSWMQQKLNGENLMNAEHKREDYWPQLRSTTEHEMLPMLVAVKAPPQCNVTLYGRYRGDLRV